MDSYRNYKDSMNNNNTDYDAQKEDDDIEALKSQIRGVKQDTLASTRVAVSKITESETMASNTLSKLGNQSEKINSIERQMELAERQADRALDKASELKTINKSMFSVFSFKNPFKNEKREQEKIDNLKKEHADYIAREDELRKTNYEVQHRVNNALSNKNLAPTNSTNTSNNSQYNFEEDEEGMKMEQEIDSNLDIVSSTLGRLKDMSLAMSSELDIQNSKLDNINKNANSVQTKINLGKDRLKTIK